MSLFVDKSSGTDEGAVQTDLFTISWNDWNLGEGAATTVAGSLNGITSIPAAPVTYTPNTTTGKPTADRLFALVNNDSTTGLSWGDPIVITPLPGGTDPYSGLDVTGNGFTYIDTGATPNVIHVVYDTSQANGKGIALFDTGGNAIQSPNAVILYHELSHAFHNAIQSIPFPQTACPGNTTDEPAAEIDENVLRTQLGLCQRDVCNHGGETGWGKACGGSATPGGAPLNDGNAPSQNGGCFIVTAATGWARAPEIEHLRAIRERISDRSSVAREMISAIYAEYWRFSPAIADRITPDSAARETVRQLIVAPLFAWHRLAETLALGGNSEETGGRYQEVMAACPPALAQCIAPLVAQVTGAADGLPPGMEEFARIIRGVDSQPLAGWALLRPLASVWQCAAGTSDPAAELVAAIGDWLASAPLECIPVPPADELEAELAMLGEFVDFSPGARSALMRRIVEAWPATRETVARLRLSKPVRGATQGHG